MTARRSRSGSRRSRLRWALSGIGVLILLLAVVAGWTYHQATVARDALTKARSEVATLRAGLRTGDVSHVADLTNAIQADADKAHTHTAGLLWSLGSHLPVIGADLHAARTMAAVVDGIAGSELPHLSQAVTALTPSRLRQSDGRFDVTALQAAQAPVDASLTAVGDAVQAVDALRTPHLNALRDARTQLTSQLDALRGDLTGAQHALDVLVPMLAPGSTKTYFVAFQNAAESHGTGGLIGNYALLTVDHGSVSLTRSGTDADLAAGGKGTHSVAVALPAEFAETWGQYSPTDDWRDANIDPNFPDAGTILAAKYEAQYGVRIDGVLALDPFVLGAIVGPTGTLPLPNGTTVTGDALPGYMLNTLYRTYATDNTGRKTLLDAIVHESFDRFAHASLDGGLLNRMEDLARTGHVQVWSAEPTVQQAILRTEVSGALPTGQGPFAFVSTLNTSRNKADYFLDRSLTYSADGCPPPGGTRNSTIKVTLTNHVPLGQPRLVSGRYDAHLPVPTPPYGQSKEYVSVFAAQGAQLVEAAVDGRTVEPDVGLDSGHPVFSVTMELPRDRPQSLVLQLTEAAAGPVRVWRAPPLRLPQTTTVLVPTCR